MASGAVSQEQAVLDALSDVAPHLLIYVMTFLTLGIFWLAQQSQLESLAATTRRLTWIHLALLFAVTLMPFSTALLGEYIDFRLALVVYWLNLVLLGALLWSALRYAARADVLGPAFTPDVLAASSGGSPATRRSTRWPWRRPWSAPTSRSRSSSCSSSHSVLSR